MNDDWGHLPEVAFWAVVAVIVFGVLEVAARIWEAL